jgi:hypothetical protein
MISLSFIVDPIIQAILEGFDMEAPMSLHLTVGLIVVWSCLVHRCVSGRQIASSLAQLSELLLLSGMIVI